MRRPRFFCGYWEISEAECCTDAVGLGITGHIAGERKRRIFSCQQPGEVFFLGDVARIERNFQVRVIELEGNTRIQQAVRRYHCRILQTIADRRDFGRCLADPRRCSRCDWRSKDL